MSRNRAHRVGASHLSWTDRRLAGRPDAPPPAATSLSFTTLPTTARAGLLLAPQPVVRVLDADGSPFSGFSGSVTIAFGANPGQGTLGGTTTVQAVNGVASFPGLSVDKVGSGYTLVASATGLTSATSGQLNVLAARVSCAPRPRVQLAVVRDGPERLKVTVRAPQGTGNEDNRLQCLAFAPAVNGAIDVPAFPGSPLASPRAGLTGSSGNVGVALSEQPVETTFTIRRVSGSQAVTVPLVVRDGRGEWHTFVGGGLGAF